MSQDTSPLSNSQILPSENFAEFESYRQSLVDDISAQLERFCQVSDHAVVIWGIVHLYGPERIPIATIHLEYLANA